MNSRILAILIVFTVFFISCENDSKEKEAQKKDNTNSTVLADQILDLEQDIMNDFDEAKVVKLIDMCLDYEKKFPKDILVPSFLFKVASNYTYIGKGYEALKYFDKVYKLYPEYERAPMCLFHKAGIYSEVLNDTAKARELATEFISKYPNHKMVEDVKLFINNLGKSLDELVDEWGKQEVPDSVVTYI